MGRLSTTECTYLPTYLAPQSTNSSTLESKESSRHAQMRPRTVNSPSDPFCTPLSVAVEQRLNPVEQHVAVQPPSCTRLNAVEQFNWPIAPIGGACSRDHAFNSG